MREILFRGQTRKYGEKVKMDGSPVDSNWVFGGIFLGSGDFSIIYTGSESKDFEKFAVYSDTVGQYTGFNDCHGTMVFEHDICRLKHSDDVYTVRFLTQDAKFELLGLSDDLAIGFDEVFPYEVEVIGNKFDNPELLEANNEST